MANNNTLSGITIPSGMEWVDKYKYSSQLQVVATTLGGQQSISSAKKIGGMPLTLVGDSAHGWMDTDTLDTLSALAETDDLQTLIWDGDTYQVRFRHHEPPAVDFTHLAQVKTCQRWYGTIKLMTV